MQQRLLGRQNFGISHGLWRHVIRGFYGPTDDESLMPS